MAWRDEVLGLAFEGRDSRLSANLLGLRRTKSVMRLRET